jgi:hypothetical protein
MTDAQNPNTSIRALRAGSKLARVLTALVEGQKLNRFDAERLGDHVLNTTVSMLAKRGVRISRRLIETRGGYGSFHCCEYWIDANDLHLAIRLLPEAAK